MSHSQHNLDRLVSRVAEDAPSISREELRVLLEARSARVPSAETLDLQTSKTRIPFRGILIMSVTILLLAFTAILITSPDRTSIKHAAITTTAAVRSESATAATVETPPLPSVVASPTFADSIKRPELKPHTPVQTDSYAPIDLPTDLFRLFGLTQQSPGELVVRFAGKQLGFSVDSAIRSHPRDSLKPTARFNPTYITDGSGRLLSLYKKEKIKNGVREYFDILDRDTRSLFDRSYYPVTSQTTWNGQCDSARGVFSTNATIQVGIIRKDTILNATCANRVDEIKAAIGAISARLLIQDSTLKSTYGGEVGLARHFALAYEPSRAASDPLQRKLKEAFTAIERDTLSPLEKADAKMSACKRLMDQEADIETKLRLEQLGRSLSYEAYLLKHEQQEKELSDLSNFIPVRVREATGLRRDGKFDNGLIFWYQVSDELIEALPRLHVTGNTVGESSFLNMHVSPNPATFYLYANYTLRKSGDVSITLHDLAGKIYLSHSKSSTKGSDRIQLSLAGMTSGIYLLSLRQGDDFVTKRVIIQR